MQELAVEVISHLRKGQRLCLATIVKKTGSGPREAGAKCLTDGSNILVGSVGGGLMEAQVLVSSKDVIVNGIPHIFTYTLDSHPGEKQGMICGGNVDILLEPVFPGHLSFWERFHQECKGLNRDSRMITSLKKDDWKNEEPPKVLWGGNNLLFGSKGLRDRLVPHIHWLPLKETLPIITSYEMEELLIEPIKPADRIVIFGSGHIARYLTMFAKILQMDITLVRERKQEMDLMGYSLGDVEVMDFDPRDLLEHIKIDEDTFVVIVTSSHVTDAEILAWIMNINPRPKYVGMIGSKRKRELIFRSLEEQGIQRRELERVHCPIGLAISAKTPQEIAVSIIAEIIKVKHESNYITH